MRNGLRRFYERYRMHHDMDRPLLQWIGVVGTVAFPLFYLLRRTSIVPPRYDDFELRALATLLCIGLALRRWWPARVRPYYIGYSWLAAFYCLSFLLSFTSLKNHGGPLSLINMVVGTMLIMLFADWRNAVAMLLTGYLCSVALYRLTDPDATIPSELALAAVTSILVVVAGALSQYGQKRAEIERRRTYAGLAGSIAHEVRTPLAQVQYALDAITGQVAEGMNPMQAVADGKQAVRRGLQAINLTLRQLNERVPDPAAFTDISAEHCVRRTVDEYAYENPQQRDNVRVEIRHDFVLRGDETTLMLVLFNLLKNALYYLPLYPHARVTLRVEAAPVCRIVVHDTGPGIAPELATGLFEEFRTAGKAEGTGLGLAFCRRSMRAFGGDIACESRLGEFTSFILTFPHAKCVQLAATTAPSWTTDTAIFTLNGRRVLVVDDSAVNRHIARARLAELGIEVVEAAHGTEALSVLREGINVDAVLMDLHMPGLTGIETTQALRAQAGPASQIPVLALTADPTNSARDAARNAGMDAYLVKPLEPALLRADLVRLLRERGQI